MFLALVQARWRVEWRRRQNTMPLIGRPIKARAVLSGSGTGGVSGKAGSGMVIQVKAQVKAVKRHAVALRREISRGVQGLMAWPPAMCPLTVTPALLSSGQRVDAEQNDADDGRVNGG